MMAIEIIIILRVYLIVPKLKIQDFFARVTSDGDSN